VTNTAPGANGGNDCNGLDNGNGLFFRSDDQYKKTLSAVTSADGTSNTLMIGEDIAALDQHCGWPNSNYNCGTCCIPLNYGMNTTPFPYGAGDWPNVYSFHSRHSNGANFALADGSVRFVTNSIDINLYRAVSTWKGGEAVSVP